MPKDLSLYESAVRNKLSSHDHELPEDIKNSFIKNSLRILTELHEIYSNQGTLREKLPKHVELHKETTKLECSFKRFYLSSVTKRISLEEDLRQLIRGAIQSVHSIVVASPNFSPNALELFFAQHISQYITFVLQAVQEETFIIQEIYDNLATIIMTDFAANVKIDCGYNIYAAIDNYIRAGLEHYQRLIDVETDVTNVKSIIPQYTPQAYRFSQPSKEPEDSIKDPCSFLDFVVQAVIEAAHKNYRADTVRNLFPGIFRMADAYRRQYLQNAPVNSSIPHSAIAANYRLKQQIRENCNSTLLVQLPLVVKNVATTAQIPWVAPYILSYMKVRYALTQHISKTINEQLNPLIELPTNPPMQRALRCQSP